MEFTELSAGKGSGTSEFILRLKDGDKVKLLLRGKIEIFKVKWNGTYYEVLTPEAAKAAGKEAKFRFRVNAVTETEGKYSVGILEQGYGLYKNLAIMNDDYPLEKNWMRLSRRGSGPTDTEYHIVPAPGGVVTPEEDAKLSKLKLHDLTTRAEVKEEEAEDVPNFGEI